MIASGERKSAEDEHVEGRLGRGDPGRRDHLVEGEPDDQREERVGEDVDEQVVAGVRASGASRARIEMTPISAAGVPPRKTIARTSARKLPEIFSCDSVSIGGHVAEGREGEQDAEQGEVPVGLPAPSRPPTAQHQRRGRAT